MHLLVSQSSFIVGASFVIMIFLKLNLGTCDKFCNFGVISNVGREKIGYFLHCKCDQQTWLRILTLFIIVSQGPLVEQVVNKKKSIQLE